MSSAAPTKRLDRPNTPPTNKGVVDWLKPFVASSVGMKATTAVTGTLLTGFVIGHLIGNLAVFKGQESLNAYAHFLKHDLGVGLWIARGGLLAAFLTHIVIALSLARRSWAARPSAYRYPGTIQASIASRTMPWTGFTILVFAIYHLAHFTFGVVTTTDAYSPATGGMVKANYLDLVDAQGRHDVYAMVVAGFRQPLIAAFYVLAQCVLFMHLKHGIGSVFQTLGLNAPRVQPFIRMLSFGLAFLIVAGNIAIVVAVWAGLVPDVTKVVGH